MILHFVCFFFFFVCVVIYNNHITLEHYFIRKYLLYFVPIIFIRNIIAKGAITYNSALTVRKF